MGTTPSPAEGLLQLKVGGLLPHKSLSRSPEKPVICLIFQTKQECCREAQWRLLEAFL